MRAKALACRGLSGVWILALLLASCARPIYTVGGTVSGLTGTGLVLQNNGGDNLAISANGAFTFSKELKKDAGYTVTVLTQPSGPTCTVANGTGKVSTSVTNVAVTCAANAFTVGGTVSGLTGTGLVLQNNGGNNLAIAAGGAFTFSTALASGATYSVTVLTQPSGQGCAVANGSGSIASANVTNVAVGCTAPPAAPTVSLGFGVKQLKFTWPVASGADFYRLSENPDGVSGYAQIATNLTTLSYNHTIPVHRRLNASYIVEACNSAGCTASAPQILGTSLTQAIGYVKASNTEALDSFGTSVALSGDGGTLAVGAPFEASGSTGINSVPDEAASNAGAVYVYARIAGAWAQQAYVKASNTETGDSFGSSVALSADGNTLAVGAPQEDGGSNGINNPSNEAAPDAGAVYVYTRAAGTWSQQAYVKASNADAGDNFGKSVALSGDGNTLAVGAPFEAGSSIGINNAPDDSAADAGAAYVYSRTGGTWSQQAYVKASNTEAGDRFGTSVALSGDGNTLAVGAPLEDSGSTGINNPPDELAVAAGAAYVYTRVAGTWSQQAYVKASNAEASDNFGKSVALSGDGNTLAIGAPAEASGTTGINSIPNEADFDAGAVYVYTRIASTWSQQAYVKASNTEAFNEFGTSVALSGDGSALAVGAQLESGSGAGIGSGTGPSSVQSPSTRFAGAAYFYTRAGGTWSQRSYVKASNTGAFDFFGNSVALSGDGNTLAVGALSESSSSTGISSTPNESAPGAGAAYLY